MEYYEIILGLGWVISWIRGDESNIFLSSYAGQERKLYIDIFGGLGWV